MSDTSENMVRPTEPNYGEFNPVLYRFRNLEIEDMEGGFIEIGNGHAHVIFDSQEILALRNWLNKAFTND